MSAVLEPKEKIRQWSHELGLVGLWEIVREVEVKEPTKKFVAALWRWKDIRPLLLRAAQDIPLAESDRRVMILSNPGVFPRHHSTNNLYVSCSIYNAQEKATVHRHSSNASRFVLEGSGGYTIIEGEKCPMSRGDFIITPNGTWHDHGNEGNEEVMWIDVLDLPLVEHLGSSFFEFDFKEEGRPSQFQSVTEPVDHSRNLYGVGGMRPTFVPHVRGLSRGSPMFVYRWKDAEAALERLRGYEGSPYDGVCLEYVNPVTGEPVTTTMSFSVQLLKPGQALKRHRHTSSSFYCCLKGRGKTIVEGKELLWGENDLVVVPTWAWHEHVNLDPRNDAVLYCVSDEPVMKKLGLYREESQPS
jgi:gentisate 1,2-dioxygenase